MTVAVALAVVLAVPPVTVTEGALVNPEPFPVMVIPETVPELMLAEAVKPDPPPPEKPIVGAVVYPEPAETMVIFATAPEYG